MKFARIMMRKTLIMSDLFKEKDRVESFSDGVFAIAITLLGLELKVPKLDIADPSAMWRTLAHNGTLMLRSLSASLLFF